MLSVLDVQTVDDELEPERRNVLMTQRRASFRWLLTACVAYVVYAAPAAGSNTIATEASGANNVDALRGRVIWSAVDPATKRYRLRLWSDGKVTTLPVPSRSVPFDATLGSAAGGGGGLSVVYSRCRRDVSRPIPGAVGAGCDLYRFELGGAREHRLRSLSSTRYSEGLPTVWGQQVAFVRAYPSRDTIRYRLFWSDGHNLRSVPGGSRYAASSKGRTGSPGPSALRLTRNALGFVWVNATPRDVPNQCPTSNPDFQISADRSEAWLVRAGVLKPQLAESACNGQSAPAFLGPGFLSSLAFFYPAANDGTSAEQLRRFDLQRHTVSQAALPPFKDIALDQDSVPYYVIAGSDAGDSIVEGDPLSFSRTTRQR